MNSITIDFTDEDSIAAAIKAELTTIELLEKILDDAVIEEDCLVLQPNIWYADDGNFEITVEVNSGEEAAQDYVDDGDWGNAKSTEWVDVHVWQEGIGSDGEIQRVNEETHTIIIEPKEPKCTKNEHDWQSPYEIVGGLRENPGVHVD